MSRVRVKLEEFTKDFLEILSRANEEAIHFLEFIITEEEDGLSFLSVDTIDGEGGTTEMIELDDLNVNYLYKFTEEYQRIKELEELLASKTLGESDDPALWAKKQEHLEAMKNDFFDRVAVSKGQ